MKIDPEPLLVEQRAASGWRIALASIAVAIAAILAVYWQTARSIHAIWDSSQTYTHGYVIVPMVLFMVWRARHEVGKLAPRPDILGFVLLGGFGMAWLVATAAGVQVLQQYAFVAMIPATVVALAGRDVGRALAFPLAFLLLAVPFGEAFVPILMDWTADFIVVALRMTGIPVYREGTFFTIPSGRWSVVEACSGLRYLIASVTVGALFAYLNYRRWWKRAVFMLASIVIPVIANFLRAYALVMTGHLSNMRLGVGSDHIVLGWFFFGVVFAALIWLASIWSDPMPAWKPVLPADPPVQQRKSIVLSFLLVVALVVAWPIYAAHLQRLHAEESVTLTAPVGVAGWEMDSRPLTAWRPYYKGTVASDFRVYRKEQYAVGLYIGYYRNQHQGRELVSSQNVLVPSTHDAWRNVGNGIHNVQVMQQTLRVQQTHLRSPQQRLLVWNWYHISGTDLISPYLAKALLARDKLLGRRDDSAALIIVAPYDERPDEAVEALQLFLRDMFASIDMALAAAKQEAIQ